MSPLEEQIAQLEAAITVQESLRPTLGDAVVDVTLAALRAQLDSLRAQPQPAATGTARPAPSPEQLLKRLQSYLPKELAEKMQAMGRIEAERKQVTVLFADISGFTALSEQFDPEEVTALTNEALKELAKAVYQYEGYIDKFIGDAIMAVFGAPVVHEDDSERALRAALAMRDRLEHFNERWVDRLGAIGPLSLHIGVNTGPVIAGNVGSDLRLSYTVMGDTVNTASRLEAAAHPGQILVSRDTYRLTQEAFTFLALDPITVKGKREPLTVFELQRAKLHPGKRRGLKGLASALVGREREMGQLRAVLAELEAKRGRIVTITGEAGIGKSRLMAEWRAEIGERALWLEGRAFAHTTSLAYGPFLDLFRRYAGINEDDSEAEARDRLHTAIDRLFPGNLEAQAVLANTLGMRLSPDESALLEDLPAVTFRWRLFALIEEFLTRLARERPALLVIEDLHWADLTSIELIEYLLLVLGAHIPVTIVGVSRLRPGEPMSKLMSVVEARHASRHTHIPLAPLSEASSLEMVEQLLAIDTLPDSLRTTILTKAEGNPFFVEEVIRSLIERGALVRAEAPHADGMGSWIVTPLMESVTVPDTLQGVLMARLDRLPDETKWAVQQAAVIGRIFLYRVLLHMADNATSLDADLSQLERDELIRERAREPEIEYIFKHALTQEVAYQTLLAPRRKELHHKVGEAMEALFADRLSEFGSIVAEHYLRAEAWEKAVNYLIRVGDAAARLNAHVEAGLHYTRTLDALAHLSDTEDNRRRRVDTTIKQVSVSFRAEDTESSLERLAEAEALAKTLLNSGGSRQDDRLRLARIYQWTGRSYHSRNEMGRAIGYYRQTLTLAQELGDEELLAIPAGAIGRVMALQGQFGKAVSLLTRAVAPLEKTANWLEWISAVAFLGGSLAVRGQYVEGLAEGQRALARALETNMLTGLAASRTCLSFIYYAGRDFVRMLEESNAIVGVAQRSGDPMYVYVGCSFRAWAESWLGHHAAALKSLAQSKTVGQSLGGQLVLADWFAAAEAEIALNAGRVEDALTLAEQAVAIAKSVEGIFAEGLAQRVWGQALVALNPPRWDEAESHMAESLGALEAGEALLEAAHTHAAWGSIRRDRGDMAAAREHFTKAAAQFEASGLEGELERGQKLITDVP